MTTGLSTLCIVFTFAILSNIGKSTDSPDDDGVTTINQNGDYMFVYNYQDEKRNKNATLKARAARTQLTSRPTQNPTRIPTNTPTQNPTKTPTVHPTTHPTTRPTVHPTTHPTTRPTVHPTT
eukprot:185431_1